MVAKLRLRAEQLAKYRRLAGIETDDALAKRMGVDPGNLSRVLRGRQSPGPKFIAALVAAFPGMDLDDLFEVVTDDESEAEQS
jgi:transcriptional regulator with XRE-family HTH domain